MTVHAYLLGAASALSVVVSIFFARYGQITRDRFFYLFAFAFALLAGNWSIVAATRPAGESGHWAYLLRLAAFLVILFAILDKNRKEPK